MSLISKAVSLPGAKNISIALDGLKMWIFCDLSKDFGTSSTGKSLVVASSSGNKALGATNAFLGLNLFCKSISERKLEEGATSDLRDLTEVGSHCQWRVEGQTLCILIDFSNVSEKVASSGKSILLATSSGNKPVGKTGIMCGMNCYIQVDKKLQIDKISTIVANATAACVGDSVDIGNGFILRMESETQVSLHYEYAPNATSDVVTMPPYCLNGDIHLALLLKPSNKKRRVVKEQKDETTSINEFVAPSAKSKNLLLHCEKSDEEDSCIGIHLRFDPTQNFGRSSTGKSLNVSSSGGWCGVHDGLFSMSFNAYKRAPAFSAEEITTAVQKVLDPQPQESLPSLSFKAVLADVLGALGLKESAEVDVRDAVKTAVKEYLQGRGAGISSQT